MIGRSDYPKGVHSQHGERVPSALSIMNGRSDADGRNRTISKVASLTVEDFMNKALFSGLAAMALAWLGMTSSAQAGVCGRGPWVSSGDSYCTCSSGMIGRAGVDDWFNTTVQNYHIGVVGMNTGVGLEYETTLIGNRVFVPMIDRDTGLPLVASYANTFGSIVTWPSFAGLQPYVSTQRYRSVCITNLSGLFNNLPDNSIPWGYPYPN
jgi:hypothetical protein